MKTPFLSLLSLAVLGSALHAVPTTEPLPDLPKDLSQSAPEGSWAAATAPITREIVGKALHLENGELVPFRFSQAAEPELIVLLFADANKTLGWDLLLFLGVSHNLSEHRRMASALKVPFLVSDFPREPFMHRIEDMRPRLAPAMMLVDREGHVLARNSGKHEEDIEAIFRKAGELLAEKQESPAP